jgi:AsmA protein
VIDGPWASPRIYPDMAGILDNPDAAYAKLKDMGKGLFGPNGALNGLGGNLPGGNAAGGNAAAGNAAGGNPLSGLLGQGGATGTGGGSDPLGGDLGKTIGNLIQQGISQGGTQGRVPGQSRALSVPPTPAAAAPPSPAPAQSDQTAQPAPESQPMNDVLRQLFNR